jgi:hypothetical protein
MHRHRLQWVIIFFQSRVIAPWKHLMIAMYVTMIVVGSVGNLVRIKINSIYQLSNGIIGIWIIKENISIEIFFC